MRTIRHRRPPRQFLLAAVAALAVAGAAAQSPNDPTAVPEHKVRSWAAACYSCHGPDGKSQFGMPPLHGRSAGEIAGALLAFRDGTRGATVMHHHAKGYTPAQLNAIATHVAAGRK